MSTDANKALIRDYYARVSAGDPTVSDLLADDVTWWVPPSLPPGGLHEGKDAVLAMMGGGIDLYDPETPLDIQVEEMVAEGPTVCVQVVIEARTAQGESYRNHYHFVFRVEGGRIVAVKEYVDSLYAQRMLFDPRQARGQEAAR